MKIRSLFLILILIVACREYNSFDLFEIKVNRLEFAKPSSIYYSKYDTAFYIATYDGIIAKCDTNFTSILQKKFSQTNFLHIFVDELFIYLISSKEFLKLDKNNFEIKSQIPFSRLNLPSTKPLGFYLNPVTKTFDVVFGLKEVKIFQFEPINFKRTKVIPIKKSYRVAACFLSGKYLYLIDNKTSSVHILDILKSYEYVKSYKFSAPEITSGSFLPPNTIFLLSTKTRRVFTFLLK